MITIAEFFNNIQNKATIRETNESYKQYFTETLNEVTWKHLCSSTDTNLSYEYFFRTFERSYNHVFLIKEVSLKLKTVSKSWLTKGLKKSFKREQQLYDYFLKSKTNEHEKNFVTRESLEAVSKI